MCTFMKEAQKQETLTIQTKSAAAQQTFHPDQPLEQQTQNIRPKSVQTKEPTQSNKKNRESAKSAWKREQKQSGYKPEQDLGKEAQRKAQLNEQFYAPSRQVMEALNQELAVRTQVAAEKQEKMSLEDYAQALDHSMALSTPLEKNKLLTEDALPTPEMEQLLEMEFQLEKCTSGTADLKALQDIAQQYRSLTVFKKTGHPSVKFLDDVGLQDQRSLFVLLSACVSTALFDSLKTQISAKQVDPSQLSQLAARMSASNLAAAAMYASQSYQDLRKETARQQKADDDQAADQDQAHQAEIHRQARLDYLKKGVDQNGKAAEGWVLGSYTQQAQDWLGTRLDELSWADFAEAVARMNDQVKDTTLPQIRLLVRGVSGDIPSQKLQAQLIEKTGAALGSGIFDPELTEEQLAQAFGQAREEMADSTRQYWERRNKLRELPGIKELDHAFQEQKLDALLNLEDEQQFQEMSQLLSEQAHYNVELIQDLIRREVSPLGRQEAFKMLTDRMTSLLLFSAPSAIMALAETRLRLINQNSPLLAQQERLLRHTLSKLGISPRWRDLACHRLTAEDTTPELMETRLRGFQQELTEKETAYFETLKDKRLTVVQWEVLNHWKEENLDLPKGEFATRLTNQLAKEEFDQEDALTREEYEALQEKEEQLAPTGYDKLIRDQALCSWPGFSGIFQGMEDQIYRAFQNLVQSHAFPFPFMEQISSIKELENLPYGDFSTLMRYVQCNMGAVAEQWSRLRTLQEDQVRAALLPGMMDGSVTPETLDQCVTDILNRANVQESVRQLRFIQQMERSVEKQERPEYQYVETTESSAVLTHDSRAQRRSVRLDHAAEFWDVAAKLPLQEVPQDFFCAEELWRCSTLDEAVRELYRMNATDEQILEFLKLQSTAMNNSNDSLEQSEQLQADARTLDEATSAAVEAQAAAEALRNRDGDIDSELLIRNASKTADTAAALADQVSGIAAHASSSAYQIADDGFAEAQLSVQDYAYYYHKTQAYIQKSHDESIVFMKETRQKQAAEDAAAEEAKALNTQEATMRLARKATAQGATPAKAAARSARIASETATAALTLATEAEQLAAKQEQAARESWEKLQKDPNATAEALAKAEQAVTAAAELTAMAVKSKAAARAAEAMAREKSKQAAAAMANISGLSKKVGHALVNSKDLPAPASKADRKRTQTAPAVDQAKKTTKKRNEETSKLRQDQEKIIRTSQSNIDSALKKIKKLQKSDSPDQKELDLCFETLNQNRQALEAARQTIDQALQKNTVYHLHRILKNYLEVERDHEDQCLVELRFQGNETSVLKDEKANEAFQKKKRAEYEAEIARQSKRIAARSSQLRQALQKWDMSQEEYELWAKKMESMLTDLPARAELKDQETEGANLDRYGASCWEDAMSRLDTYLKQSGKRIRSAPPQEPGVQAEEQARLREQVTLLHTRQAMMDTYKDGLLRPLVPKLLENSQVWYSLLSGRDEDAQAYIQKLDSALSPALSALSLWAGYGPEFVSQLLLWYGQDIIKEVSQPSGDTQQQWQDKFSDYYARYTEHKEGGTSIGERLQKLQSSDQTAFNSLISLLHDPDMGLEILKNDESLQIAVAESRQNLVPNRQAFKSFCEENKLTGVERSGLNMYLHRSMLKSTPQDFLAGLPEALVQFRQDQHKANIETQAANKVMDEKWKVMRDIEKRKAQNRMPSAASAAEARIDALRKAAHSTPSLFLKLMGTSEAPLTDQLIDQSRLAVHDQYQELPKPVRDLIAEVTLNGYLTQTTSPVVETVKTAVTQDLTPTQAQAVDAVQEKLSKLMTHEKLRPNIQWIQEEYDTILQLSEQKKLPGELTEAKLYELLLARYTSKFKPPVPTQGAAGQAAPKAQADQRTEEQALVDTWNGYQRRQESIDKLKGYNLNDPTLEAQRSKAMEALHYAKYTMTDQEFSTLVEERSRYFQRGAQLMKVIGQSVSSLEHEMEVLDQKIAQQNQKLTSESDPDKANALEEGLQKLTSQRISLSADDKLMLKSGLREYFRSYMTAPLPTQEKAQPQGDQVAAKETQEKQSQKSPEDQELDQLRSEMADLLSNQDKIEYLKDSTNLLSSVGNMAMTAKEKAFQGEIVRADLERFLSTCPDQETVGQYFLLTRQQRQVFAISVLSASRVKSDQRLFSSSLLRDKERETGEQKERSLALYAYTKHQDFDPSIDYSQVLEALKQPTSAPGAPAAAVLNSTLFQNAMLMTRVAMAQHAKNTETDLQRLSNGAESLDALSKMSMAPTWLRDRKNQVPQSISTDTEFFQQIKDITKRDLSGLSPLKKSLLIQVLQDRTLLDYTTAVPGQKQAQNDLPPIPGQVKAKKLAPAKTKGGKKKGKGIISFVNAAGRQALKSRWVEHEDAVADLSLNELTLSNAFLSLRSYQIRDDVDLTGRKLSLGDFAPGALTRVNELDTDLLDRALAFVDEVEKEKLRLNAVSQASALITAEGNKNELAKAAYRKLQEEYKDPNAVTSDQLVAFLRQQALAQEDIKDSGVQTEQEKAQTPNPNDPDDPDVIVHVKDKEKAAIMAGILELTPQQRDLFIKALSHREVLDISKQDIMYNRLGIAQRDFVNAKARNELLDEYLSFATGTGGSVALEPDSCYKAMVSALSTQVADDYDFSTLGPDQDLSEALVSNSHAFKKSRGTAVDWKLVSRALQFVHRAENERNIFLEDRDLYLSQGDISETGNFQFNSGYMRRNIHNAGNRFSRFLLRRTVVRSQDLVGALMDQVPEELAPAMDFISAHSSMFLSKETQNKLKKNPVLKAWKANPLPPSEEESQQESGGFLESMQSLLSPAQETETAQPAPQEETAEEKIKAGAMALAPIFTQMYTAYQGRQNAETYRADDEQKAREASRKLTPEQAERVRKATARNESFQKSSTTMAHVTKCTEVLESVASVAGDVLGTAMGPELKAAVSAAVNEAGQLVNYMVRYCTEKQTTTEYFRKSGDVERLKQQVTKMGLNADDFSDMDLIQNGLGYENETELGSFVGLNLTRSLLFCASPFVATTQKHLYLLAMSTLTMLGQQAAAGKQDNATAMRVYNALMGGTYRN